MDKIGGLKFLMNEFSGFYKDKTVLVTGHTGFKGSWITLWLINLGAKVIGYSNDTKGENSLFSLAKLSEKIVDIRADVTDYNKLREVFEEYNPEIVFHLAAQPIVRKSYDIPVETLNSNIMGTVNVLECIRHSSSVKSAVMITSDKCYKNKNVVWGYRENDELGGSDPYSASKACAEIVINSYVESYFKNSNTNICSVRAGNVIGGGDWAEDRIIPDCIRALEKGENINVRNPQATRPWQHVLEPLYGYLLLGKLLNENDSYQGAWNFGPKQDSVVPVKILVNKLLSSWGNGSWNNINNADNKYEMKLLCLDSSKSKYGLNWHPVLSLNETVNLIVDWYKNYNTDVYNLSVNQINKFIELKNQRCEN